MGLEVAKEAAVAKEEAKVAAGQASSNVEPHWCTKRNPCISKSRNDRQRHQSLYQGCTSRCTQIPQRLANCRVHMLWSACHQNTPCKSHKPSMLAAHSGPFWT